MIQSYTTQPQEDQAPRCGLCHAPCGKGLGAQTTLVNRFWGGSEHGTKVFYTDEHTYYFCSEDHRTAFIFGAPRNDDGTGTAPATAIP
jgi:hypothetical protein